MDAKDLLLDALDKRGTAYQEKLQLCRDDFSKGAVHDWRTSIRRLSAALEVAAFMTSPARVEKLSQRLKEQLDGVGDLRDVQVMLDRASEDSGMLPEIKPFQDHLEKRRKRRERTGEKHVQDVKAGGVKKRLAKIRAEVEELSAEELNGKLPQAVDGAYLTVVQRYGEIDPEQLVSIHHLRVAFKKFRYMVEVVYPCLPGFPAEQLERMHDYQTRMGDIHDLEVLLEELDEFTEDHASYYLEPVRRFYGQILADCLSAYLENKAQVLMFWRATPLTAFPWNANPNEKEE